MWTIERDRGASPQPCYTKVHSLRRSVPVSYLSKALLTGEVVERQPRFSNMAQFGAPTVEFVVLVVAWTMIRQATLTVLDPVIPDGERVQAVLRWAYWIGLSVLTLRFVWRMVYRAVRLQFREIAITNRRFMEKDGVFNIHYWSTDLEKIVRLSIDQPILGRIFDYGSITIITVGEVEHTTAGLAEPIALQNALHARMQVAGAPAAINSAGANSPSSITSAVNRPADV